MQSQQPSNPYEEKVVVSFGNQINNLVVMANRIGIDLSALKKELDFKNQHQNDFSALRVGVVVLENFLNDSKVRARDDISTLARQIQAKASILAEVIEYSHYIERGTLSAKDGESYLKRLEGYTKSFREGTAVSNFIKYEHNHALEKMTGLRAESRALPRKDSLKRGAAPPIPPRPAKKPSIDPKHVVEITEIDRFNKLEKLLHSHMLKSWSQGNKLVKKTKVEDPKFVAYELLLDEVKLNKKEVEEGRLTTEQAFGKDGRIREYIDDLIKASDMKMSRTATFFGKTSEVATGLRKFLKELETYHPSQKPKGPGR